MHRSAATLLVTVVLIVGSVSASAAFATTGPNPYAIVKVSLQDSRIILSSYRVHDVTYVDFLVHNAGKLHHNFRIGGIATKSMPPGQTTHLLVAFPAYGKYRFVCTIHGTAKMSGSFQVDRPVQP
jgi:plastocyanin